MDHLIPRMFGILRAIWAQRRIGVVAAWAIGLLAAGIIMRMPDKYEATARIYVDTQSILKPLMVGLAVQPNYEQQIVMLSRTLITRPNVEEIIRMADLDLGTKSRAAYDEQVDEILKQLEIKSTSRDGNIYTLSYRNPKPESAKKVIEAAVAIFIGSSLGGKRTDAHSAIKFIDDQIKIYEKKLEEAEARLKEFKIRNVEIQLFDGRATEQLPEVMNQLNTARLALREAEQSRDVLRQQLLNGQSVSSPRGGDDVVPAIPEIDGRLESMKRTLDTLLQRYTEEHPDVVGARRVIRELEDQRTREIAARMAASSKVVPAKAANPVLERLSIALAESEANVASLRARVGEYEMRAGRLKANMKTMPLIEAEFAQLNRDYDIQKKSYEQLVTRRESASLSDSLGTAGGGAEFRQIEPPRVNPKPVAPNRLVLLPAALVMSLIAGLGVAYLVGGIRSAYFDAESLRNGTELPVLGTVTLQLNDSMRRSERRSIRRVVLATGGLILLYGAGVAVLAMRSGVGAP